MSRVLLASLGVVVFATSCDPRKFDSLKDTTWVSVISKDDLGLTGDWVLSVTSVPLTGGAAGARFIGGAWAPNSGLGEITFDASGNITEQLGIDAEMAMGQLNPFTFKMSAEGLAPYGDTGKLVVGVPFFTEAGIGNVMTIGPELTGGAAPDTTTVTNLSQMGTAVAAGNLGIQTGPNPDIVAVGELSIAIFPGDGSAVRTCGIKRPPEPSNPITGIGNLALADVTGIGHDEIIVSGFDLANEGRIYVIDPTTVVGNVATPCPNLFSLDTGTSAPIAIAVGNLDADPHLEIVAGDPGIVASTGAQTFTGSVTVYKNVMDDTALTVTVTPPDTSSSTTVFGGRLKIANVISEPTGTPDVNELIIGDPGADPQNTQNAGQVSIYRMSDLSVPLAVLYNPSPNKDDRFGRDLATSPFPTPTSTRSILAVASKDYLWVYFQVVSGDDQDPRQH